MSPLEADVQRTEKQYQEELRKLRGDRMKVKKGDVSADAPKVGPIALEDLEL